ncbi:signal protein PDZ [Pseudidiomarina aestuarii]|uniref:Signal protein PDZ n=1 Tax=Pseudidiomarina aestuarii TaxID=624146 RepID=A0A7Z7ET88_9GAMM|nr:pepsin/retropepsin-like aspartic protease family protein [Pseudidiomarina aestuarii]RUO40795.1 signal protein PDZ [Pseudidiomarina aestuarii]
MRKFLLSLVLMGSALLGSNAVLAQATSWVPFEHKNGHVRIKVEVAGIESWAIIDSGSQLNGINLDFLEEHGLEFKSHSTIKVKGVYETKDRNIFKDIPTKILGLELNMELVGIDFGSSVTSLLIGAPVLNQFVVQFDYPNSRLRFANPGTFNLRDISNLEMRAQDGTGKPLVKVNLNGESDRWFLLDTGSSGGLMMPRNVVTSHDWLEKYPIETGMSMGVNGMAPVETFLMPTVGFGPFVLENVKVTLPAEGSPIEFGEGSRDLGTRMRGVQISGLVGYDLLKHFVLTIDYRNGEGHIYVPK